VDGWWVRLAPVGGIMPVWKSLPEGQPKERRKDMTEGQRDAPDRPEAERYYAQYASLEAGESGTAEAALQEAINEGARQSWKLISVTQDPTSSGVILVWDTSGFFSG
jgi:hypothetical protein